MNIKTYALNSDPAHLKAAFADLGLKEISGPEHSDRVIEMFAKSGHPWVQDDETAWCAAAVGAWLREAGTQGSGSLAARSYLKWGKKTTRPKRGDVVVFRRGNSSWQGHVALYLGESADRVHVIGGNQSNAVTVTSYPKSRLLGYRKPARLRNSKVAASAGAIGLSSAYGIADVAGYAPDAIGLVQTIVGDGSANWIAIAGFTIALALAAFIIWDRFVKTKELGV